MDEVWRYYYCIKNQRKYRGHVVDWHDEAGTPFFVGLVPHSSERFNYRDTATSTHSVWKGKFKIDDLVLDAETIGTPKEAIKTDKKLTIRAHSSVEVPAHPKIAEQILAHTYTDWKPADLLKVSLDFSSTLDPDASGKSKISNELLVTVEGDEMRSSNLREFPLEIRPTMIVGPLGDFWGSPEEMLFISDLAKDAKVGQSVWTASGDIQERVGLITIGQGKQTYAIMPVTYFSPLKP